MVAQVALFYRGCKTNIFRFFFFATFNRKSANHAGLPEFYNDEY